MFKIDLQALKRLSTYRGAIYHDGFRWVYGSLILEDQEKDIYSIRVFNKKNEPPRYTDYVVETKSIAPITEFKDMEGQDLFVGDIIDFISMPGSPGYSRAIVIMEQGTLKAQDQDGRSIHLSVIGDQFMIRGNFFEDGAYLLKDPAIPFLNKHDEVYMENLKKFEAFRDDVVMWMAKHKVTVMETEDQHFFKVDGALTMMVPVTKLIVDWTVKAIEQGPPRSESLTLDDLKPGDFVTYVGKAGSEHTLKSIDLKEHGRVKKVTDKLVYVVFNCGGDWENWMAYTGIGVHPAELVKGWEGEKEERHIMMNVFNGETGEEGQKTFSSAIELNEKLTQEGSPWVWISYKKYKENVVPFED
jgi:hypothetical protein